MKKNIFRLLTLFFAVITLAACEDVNDKLDLDGKPIIDTREIAYTIGSTFGDDDYTLMAQQLRANKNKEDSIMATALLKDKMFSESVPAEKILPLFLKARYYSRDAGTPAKITYKYKGSAQGVDPETIISEAENTLFPEDFQSLPAGTGVAVAGNGWIMKDLKGSYKWENRERTVGTVMNRYAQVSSFKSAGENEIWLITKAIDLSKLTDPLFKFDIVTGNYTATCLEIRISENFSGNENEINSATWTNITSNFTLPTPATGYSEWASAGTFDMKAYKGKKVYIAFKYIGDDTATASPKKTTTYQIDNVKVYEKQVVCNKMDQFIRTKTDGWLFDPTHIIDFRGNKNEFQTIVDYVKVNQGVQTPALVDSRGNAEFYYGFSAYYANVTYRDKDRVNDPSFPVDASAAEKTAFMNKRVGEGLAAYLSVKFPNATPTVSGIDQLAIIKDVLIYSDPSSTIANQYFTYTMQCVGNKEWKAISRESEATGVEDLTQQ